MGDLIGLVFSEALPTGLPLLKIDAFLPARKPDDHRPGPASGIWPDRLKVNTLPPIRNCFRSLPATRELRAVQNLHQYVSLDFVPGGPGGASVPGGGVKLNLYTRPFRTLFYES